MTHQCPVCQRSFAEPGFCPFDGKPLQSTAIASQPTVVDDQPTDTKPGLGESNKLIGRQLKLRESTVKVHIRQIMRKLGATNRTRGRPHGLMGRNRFARVLARLERARKDGRIPATFEVVYGHAWKGEPRTTAEGHPIVRLQRPGRPR